MKNNRILVVEDNQDVSLMITEVLTEEGYQTDACYTGLEALQKIKEHNYDLILLDIMLPYVSGDQILKEIRSGSEVPVIILSAKDMVGTKIDLLKLGADDYITKPFDLGELSARIAVLLRRFYKKDKEPETYEYQDIRLEISSCRIFVNQIEMEATAKEYKIIELLLKHPDKIFTRENLYETVWQDDFANDDNAVKVHISNLRSKLKHLSPDREYIETVWGLGYRLFKMDSK